MFNKTKSNTMSDTYIFEDSNEVQTSSEPFVSRQVVYVLDQSSGGNYSGSQVLLDTTSLSNSGKYVSYQECYFEIPLVMRLTATSANAQIAAIRNLDSSFALGLKSNFANIIHSFSVELNNQTIVQLTPYSNFYITYKMLTSFSADALKKYATILGFFPDSTQSVQYGSQTVADASGHGSINNRNLPEWPSTVYSYGGAGGVLSTSTNMGLYTRQATSTAFNPAQGPISSFISASQAGTVGLNYFRKGTGADIDSKWWFVLATLRLKDLHSVFQQLPLSRGTYLRFIMNMNQATHNLALTVAGGALTDVSVTSSILANGTSPMLLAKANALGNGMAEIADACVTAGAGTYTFQMALSIGRDQTYNVSHPALQQVRLYAPLYQLSPVFEEQYLTLNKIKRVVYTDIYQYSLDVSCAGSAGSYQGQFNALITNGLVAPKSVIIVPFVGAAANKVALGANPLSPFQSPFASEPSTTSPYITLTNLQVMVAGINVFQTQETYSFQNFLDEFKSMNAINGSNLDGIDSGLIGFEQWIGNYSYYIADISRRLPAEQVVPKSIQLSGTVQSGSLEQVSLYVFVEVEKEFTIDLSTGQKLS